MVHVACGMFYVGARRVVSCMGPLLRAALHAEKAPVGGEKLQQFSLFLRCNVQLE